MRLPRNISGVEAVKAFRRMGFESARQTGSHHIMRNASGKIIVIPMHKPIKPGTLSGILQQADITAEELLENL